LQNGDSPAILRLNMATSPPFCDGQMAFIERIFQPGKDNFFLLGPRGTGTTAWSLHQYPDALRIDLLDSGTLRQLAAQPERLRDILAANPNRKQIIIDEIQKLPALLEMVHLLIERKTGQQFVLIGSSARKLRRQGVNLLGGRAAEKHLYPYMACELGKTFRLDRALRQGLLPVVWAAKNPDDILQAYDHLYLHEEVQMEGLVRNVGSFARFLESMSFAHGSVLNLSNVARDAQVSRKTVEGYLDVLEDLMLGFRLEVFAKRAKRALASHPKFYFFDTGVFLANRPAGPLDATSEIDGVALEGLVAQHLRTWCDYSAGRHGLHYWQTRAQVEVDFVVYGESGIYAVEVKNARQIRPEDLRALQRFGEDYPQSRRYLLYRGKERLQRNGVLCMPCEEFLLQLRPGEFPE
jgi:predicted AAA+ superfamily ATPase